VLELCVCFDTHLILFLYQMRINSETVCKCKILKALSLDRHI
jgi:hypothetical protein